jgi:hypothetical protein
MIDEPLDPEVVASLIVLGAPYRLVLLTLHGGRIYIVMLTLSFIIENAFLYSQPSISTSARLQAYLLNGEGLEQIGACSIIIILIDQASSLHTSRPRL